MTIKKKAEKITVQGILGMPDGEYIRYTEANPSPRKPKKPRRMNGKIYPGASTSDALSSEIVNLKVDLGQAMDTIGDMNIELENHLCRLSKLEHTINGPDYTGLDGKVEDTRRWMGGVRNHLDALERRTQELEKAKGGADTVLYSKNSVLMAQLFNANKELETLKNQYRTLADAYAEKEREVKAKENILTHERADGQSLLAEFRALKKKNETLKAEMAQLDDFLLRLARDETLERKTR